MKIAKEFSWEMSHRLPFHKGQCNNIHGHSYKLRLTLDGQTNSEGMLLDFYELEKILMPLLDKLDHSFVCDKNDTLMLNFLKENNFKLYIIDDFSTCENLANMIADQLQTQFESLHNIDRIVVRLYETYDAYSEVERLVR